MQRRATRADIDRIVEVHRASFPGFFLSFLGRRFLRELYLGILEDSRGILIVSVDESGSISGFVAGVAEQQNFYRDLLAARKWRFAFAAASSTLRRPTIIPRLLRALRRDREAAGSAAAASLMSIAVHPGHARRGGGAVLVEAFIDALRARGVRDLSLTTDAEGNEAVNAFYRKLEFVMHRSYVTPEGRRMNEYRKEISAAAATAVV